MDDAKRSKVAGHTIAVAVAIAALLVGEIAMVTVVGFTRWLMPNVGLAWLVSVVLVTAGGYMIFGYPIVRAFRSSSRSLTRKEDIDLRTKWAVSFLRRTSLLWFTLASIVGGATGIAWYYGARGAPSTQKRALVGQGIMACFWCALYLGLLNIILR